VFLPSRRSLAMWCSMALGIVFAITTIFRASRTVSLSWTHSALLRPRSPASVVTTFSLVAAWRSGSASAILLQQFCLRSHAWLSWFALSLDMLLLHRTLSSSASPGRLICLQLPDWLRLSAQHVSRAPVDRRTAFYVSWTHLCREILTLQA